MGLKPISTFFGIYNEYKGWRRNQKALDENRLELKGGLGIF